MSQRSTSRCHAKAFEIYLLKISIIRSRTFSSVVLIDSERYHGATCRRRYYDSEDKFEECTSFGHRVIGISIQTSFRLLIRSREQSSSIISSISSLDCVRGPTLTLLNTGVVLPKISPTLDPCTSLSQVCAAVILSYSR